MSSERTRLYEIEGRELGLGSVDPEHGTESICGPTVDWVDVELYSGNMGVSQAFVNSRQPAVGHLEVTGCSGTLVSRDLFLSAGHCGYIVGDQIAFNYQVNGSSPPNVRAKDLYQVVEVVEQLNSGTFDYALVRLSGSPGDRYGYTPIIARDQAQGSTITVIQHPATQSKKVHTGALLDYSSSLGANWFRHQADTTGGSSGSGVLSPDGFVVGVHTNAGCSSTAPFGGNSAMRMTSLVNNSPRLRALANGDIPLVGDFDSDGQRDDLGIFRASEGRWYATRTNGTSILAAVHWGTQGDIPMVEDFDGDGQTDDLGVWRPSDGTWWATRTDGTVIMAARAWGTARDIPLVGDFDSDGRVDDIAVFRPSQGTWYAARTDGTALFHNLLHGLPGDIPVVGDYDSDGFVDDVGVFRPSNGNWYAMRTNGTTIFNAVHWGTMDDVPFVADFDGDGQFDDLGVWRPTAGRWYARTTGGTELTPYAGLWWGALGDIPLIGDLDSDGRVDDVGLWRSSSAAWFAKRIDGSAPAWASFVYGLPR